MSALLLLPLGHAAVEGGLANADALGRLCSGPLAGAVTGNGLAEHQLVDGLPSAPRATSKFSAPVLGRFPRDAFSCSSMKLS